MAVLAPSRVVVFRALNLGDLLLAVPALRALRLGCPSAEIDFIGLPWARSFLERYGYVDTFFAFPGYPGIPEGPTPPVRLAAFVRRLGSRHYDVAVQLHGSGETSNGFVRLLGAARTLAHVPAETRTDGVELGRLWHEDEYEVERWLRLVGLLGIPAADQRLEFPITEADERELAARVDLAALERRRPLVGIHPGAKPAARRWAPRRFAQVADDLVRHSGAQVVLLGGPGESWLAKAVEEAMAARPLNLAERTPLGALGALLRRLDLLVGNDSGPAHLARAVGTPTVTLFGPSSPARWGPRDAQRHRTVRRTVSCSPCPFSECPIDHRCLARLSAEQVLAEATALLEAA